MHVSISPQAPSHPGCHTTLSSSHSVFGWVNLSFSVRRVEVFSLNWKLLKSTISCFLSRKYLLLLLSLWVIGTARHSPPRQVWTDYTALMLQALIGPCVWPVMGDKILTSPFFSSSVRWGLCGIPEIEVSPPLSQRRPHGHPCAPPSLRQWGRGSCTGANAGGAAPPALLWGAAETEMQPGLATWQ